MKIRIFQNNVQGFFFLYGSENLVISDFTNRRREKKKSEDIDLRPAAHT